MFVHRTVGVLDRSVEMEACDAGHALNVNLIRVSDGLRVTAFI